MGKLSLCQWITIIIVVDDDDIFCFLDKGVRYVSILYSVLKLGIHLKI